VLRPPSDIRESGDTLATLNYSGLLARAPDPEAATMRFERLLLDDTVRRGVEKMSAETLPVFVHLLSISHFLFRYLLRHPDAVALLGNEPEPGASAPAGATDVPALRQYKYQELLKITWMDLCGRHDYRQVLFYLSQLADNVITRCLQLVTVRDKYPTHGDVLIPFCVFAMGKLGARELNYSSDVDLIFVCADDPHESVHAYEEGVTEQIRRFNQAMEENTEEGFLYRVDLKLRPLGRSGPLVLSVDQSEHYYEASTEAWERFAWLRARIIGGATALGQDLLERLQPFIYLRALGSDDLNRFIDIKQQMAKQRQRQGSWNVKLGEGGIRDIEFFIQMLQAVNASARPELKTTNTLDALQELVEGGFIAPEDGRTIHDAYLFLRRLENRLQMMDEQQTHQLPDRYDQRMKIASSMGFGENGEALTMEAFNRTLDHHRKTALSCFERILPAHE
jgi:glutamate-ammonia-ligase adenylyltransferase